MARFLPFCLVFCFAVNAEAQNRDRRNFIESLLQGLIESQLDRRRPDPPPQQPNRQITRELRQVREMMVPYENQTTQLVSALRQRERQLPQLRPLLGSAIEVSADARVLRDLASQVDDHRLLTDEVRSLDREWRSLAYQLGRISEVDRQCMSLVNRINESQTQLCSILGLEPQFDRQTLLRLVSEISASITHLNRDLSFQIHRDPQSRGLITQGYELSTQANQLAFRVQTSEYSAVAQQAEQFYANWQNFSQKLRGLNSDRLRSDALSIEKSLHQMLGMLWLPVPVDRAQIVQLANVIEGEFHAFLETVTLVQLIDLRNAQALISSAREFDAAAHQFSEAAAATANINDLSWDFQQLEVQWNEFEPHGRAVQQVIAQERLRVIRESLALLQESLRLQPALDREELLRISLSIDDLTVELASTTNTVVERSRAYQPAFRTSLNRSLEQLHEAAHHFHDTLLRNHSDRRIEEHAVEVLSRWNDFKRIAAQLRRQEQFQLGRLLSQIEPAMVKLQVIFQ